MAYNDNYEAVEAGAAPEFSFEDLIESLRSVTNDIQTLVEQRREILQKLYATREDHDTRLTKINQQYNEVMNSNTSVPAEEKARY